MMNIKYKGKTQKQLVNNAMKALEEFTSEEDSKRLEGEIKVLLRNSGFFADKSYIKGRR